MLYAILSKNWWKTLVKSDETGEGNPPADALAADSSQEIGEAIVGEALESGGRVFIPDEPAVSDKPARLAPESEEDDDDSSDLGDNGGAAAAEPFVEDAVPTTAYDLDNGRPLEPRTSALPRLAKVRNAKEFFATEMLYRYDIMEQEDRQRIAGKYRIELKGYRGGVWTVAVGDEVEVVNRREEADVVLIMQQREFISLVNGDINPQLAILAQKMKVLGDVRKASEFQALLYPAGD